MFYALKVGPIETGEGPANAYLGFDDGTGLLSPPVVERDDEAGLRQLIVGAPPGSRLRCEPGLARAGRRLSFEPAPLPADVIPIRATLALGFSLGTLGSGIRSPDALFELADAAASFVRAAPWQYWDSDSPLEVVVSGPVSGSFEGSILGGGGETYGLALYTERGAIARIGRLVDQGRMREAARVDSLAVTLDDEPRYAVEALDAAFGLRAVPSPMRIRRGKPVETSDADLVALAAALRAVGQLSPAALQATGEGAAGRIRVAAGVRAPAPLVEEPPAERTGVRRRVGRNEPCPCGSGRKYKKCHGPLDDHAAQPTGSTEHERDQRLVNMLMEYAGRQIGPRWSEAVAGYPTGLEPRPPDLQLLVPWSVYECHVGGRTVVDWYIRERGRRLSAADRAWLEAQQRAWLSVWEVQAVNQGASVTVRDLLTGEERTVTEVMGSRALAARDAVLARVVDGGDGAVFCGCHPRSLGPIEADAVVSHARRRLRARSGPVRVARLKAEGTSEMLIARWEAQVKALDRRPAPRLANTDGDPILWTADHFALASGSRAEVERRIAAMEHVDGPEHHGAVARFTVPRPGNRLHRSWENTVVGSIEVSADAVKIEANSVRRADDLRQAVERACARLVAHRIREHSDPTAAIRRGISGPAESPPPEEVAAALREMKRQAYADWLDEPIPLLGGLTPREATRTARPRHKLAVLLKDLENRESRLPPGERLDVAALRAELGLSGDGIERRRTLGPSRLGP